MGEEGKIEDRERLQNEPNFLEQNQALRCEVGDVLPPSDSAPSDPALSVRDAASGCLTPRYAQNLLSETEDAA